MKILSIIFDLDKGGAQRAAQVFAEAYQQLGHDSRLLVFYDLGVRFEELSGNIKIWQYLSDKNIDEIKKWMPDVIHIHAHALKSDDVAGFLNTLPLNQIKVIEQNVFSTPSAWTKQVDCSFQFSYWAYWLYKLRGGDISRAGIVPNPVRCDSFTPSNESEVSLFKKKYNIPEDAYVIGRIGQNYIGKWSVVTINVFNNLAKTNSNIYLVLVNPPANILKAVSKSRYKNRIINIESIIGDKQLSIAYSAFDVMLRVAEMGESFGYVLVESILCGTPVVTLSTPWGDNSQCEVVKNGNGGFIAQTQKGLVKALNLYINKDVVYDPESARQRMIDDYDYIKVAKKALASLDKGNNDKQVQSDFIIKILKDTIDKTKILTVLLLRMNCLFCRKLTAYQYHPKTLLVTLFRKIREIIN